MDYKQAIEYFHSAQRFGSRLGLEAINDLLEKLGNPHHTLRYVHVAGTNGKGSTTALLSNILMQAGYRVGVYTSPYIQRFSERIRIGKTEISQKDLAQAATQVRKAAEQMPQEKGRIPTEFDLLTATALLYFAKQKCDIVVMEVGLGGRRDSTNCIPAPEVAVIASIGYDHMDVLGNTLEQIAFDKAGIIKSGCEVVLYPQQPSVQAVFETVCSQQKANLHTIRCEQVTSESFSPQGQTFSYGAMSNLQIALLGEHQIYNAALAVRTAQILAKRGYLIDEDQIRAGLLAARWPGRMEVLCSEPLVLIDGGHNVQGAQALAAGLTQYFPEKKFVFLVGVLADKQYREMLQYIAPLAKRFLTITPQSPRALSAADLSIYLQGQGFLAQAYSSVAEALDAQKGKDEAVCAFGSLYFIGEVRSYFGID